MNVVALVAPRTAGRLLVAAPPLVDPNFDRSVVFMLNHDDDGALGLVLNRPDEDVEVPGIERWMERTAPPRQVFTGGPVEEHGLIGLAQAPGATAGESWAPVVNPVGPPHLGTVDLSSDPLLLPFAIEALRVFRGYSGWGPGQLDDELESGAWIVADARAADLFSDHPENLWRAVLGRQQGRLAWLAHFPDDVSVN
jgi:putative transcriptional regulator